MEDIVRDWNQILGDHLNVLPKATPEVKTALVIKLRGFRQQSQAPEPFHLLPAFRYRGTRVYKRVFNVLYPPECPQPLFLLQFVHHHPQALRLKYHIAPHHQWPCRWSTHITTTTTTLLGQNCCCFKPLLQAWNLWTEKRKQLPKARWWAEGQKAQMEFA